MTDEGDGGKGRHEVPRKEVVTALERERERESLWFYVVKINREDDGIFYLKVKLRGKSPKGKLLYRGVLFPIFWLM